MRRIHGLAVVTLLTILVAFWARCRGPAGAAARRSSGQGW